MQDFFILGWILKFFTQSAHNKEYDNDAEEQKRKLHVLTVSQRIEQHNAEYAAGKQTFKMGLNQHADLTFEEFQQRRLGYKTNRDIK